MTATFRGANNQADFVAVTITNNDPTKSIKIKHNKNIEALCSLSKCTIKEIQNCLSNFHDPNLYIDDPNVYIVLSQHQFGDYGFVKILREEK